MGVALGAACSALSVPRRSLRIALGATRLALRTALLLPMPLP
jgi:hypothetical protein